MQADKSRAAQKRDTKEATKAKKYVSPSQYRGSLETDVQVGEFWYRIQKIDPALMSDYVVLSDFDLEKIPEEERTQRSLEANKKIVDLLLPACILKPTVVAGEGDDDTLGTDDLQGFDQTILVSKILEFSGLTGEAIEGLRSFRE